MPHVFREALRYVNVFDAAIVCRMLLPGIAELVSGKDGSDVLSLVIEGGVAGELAVTHMLATCDRATRARVLAYAQEHPRHAARLRYGLVYASTEDEDEVLRSAAHEIRRSLDDE